MKKKTVLAVGALLVSLGVISTAEAATYTFDFTHGGDKINFNTRDFQDGTSTLTARVGGFTDTTPSVLNDDQRSRLNQYSGGLGVGGGDSPYHAMENNNGIDYIKLTFSEDVVIKNVVLGWVYRDGDIAYGTGPSGLTEVSWNNSAFQVGGFSLTEASNTWRIAASIDMADGKKDYFKISSVTVETVPIPAAFWLFGSAVIGLLGLGRWAHQARAA